MIAVFDDPIGFLNPGKREDRVVLTADHHELTRSDHRGKIPHIEIAEDTRHVIADAVVEIDDGIPIGTNRTGRHIPGKTILQARNIIGSRASAGIAHADRAVKRQNIGKMCFHGIQHPTYIPNSFRNRTSAEKQCCHGRSFARRTLIRTAALSKAALLDSECAKAFFYRAYRKIPVAAMDALLIARIFRDAERDVRAGGMALQTHTQRQRSGLFFRQQDVAVREIAFLGLKREVDMVAPVFPLVLRDFENRITAAERVHAEPCGQSVTAFLLIPRERTVAGIAVFRLDLGSLLFVQDGGIKIHESLLSNRSILLQYSISFGRLQVYSVRLCHGFVRFLRVYWFLTYRMCFFDAQRKKRKKKSTQPRRFMV